MMAPKTCENLRGLGGFGPGFCLGFKRLEHLPITITHSTPYLSYLSTLRVRQEKPHLRARQSQLDRNPFIYLDSSRGYVTEVN